MLIWGVSEGKEELIFNLGFIGNNWNLELFKKTFIIYVKWINLFSNEGTGSNG